VSYVLSPHNAFATALPPSSPSVALPPSSSTTMTRTTKRSRVGFGRGGLVGRSLGEERSRRINAVVVKGKGDNVPHPLFESGDEENTDQFRYISPRFFFDEEMTTESVSPHLEASYFVDKKKVTQVNVILKWRIPDKSQKRSSCGLDGDSPNLTNNVVDAGKELSEATNSEPYSKRRKGDNKVGSSSSLSSSYLKPYIHVIANRYNPRNRPKHHPPIVDCCQCNQYTKEGVGSCGDMCLNRIIHMECVGNSVLKTGKRNPYWNCNCGTECGNRDLSNRKFARPAREHGKGWGLITVEGVSRGNLVQEYVGEIIDKKTMDKRILKWSRDYPNDPNFYTMYLEAGWYIDARKVGNEARFINHSCDPNCKLVPVNVAGYMRVSIVCIKDVPPGGFLSIDYQFDQPNGDKFKCRCGSANCHGKMNGGKAKEKLDKRMKKQLQVKVKAGVQHKKLLQGVKPSKKDRLHLKRLFVMRPNVNNDNHHRIVSSVCGGGSRKIKYGEGGNTMLYH
ncbi:hypothetical protein ACHAXA_005241, partial [Cyclostephanos tholiformis]